MERKKRHILKKDWTRLRSEIERVRKAFQISFDDFRELKINEWKSIEDKIEENFLSEKLPNSNWIWNNLKVESISINCKTNPFDKLDLLLDKKEKVYFFVNETVSEQTKYWYYEGRIESIMQILEEVEGFDEFYLCSKKYDWLLCVNHHDVLIGTRGLISKIRANESKF